MYFYFYRANHTPGKSDQRMASGASGVRPNQPGHRILQRPAGSGQALALMLEILEWGWGVSLNAWLDRCILLVIIRK